MNIFCCSASETGGSDISSESFDGIIYPRGDDSNLKSRRHLTELGKNISIKCNFECCYRRITYYLVELVKIKESLIQDQLSMAHPISHFSPDVMEWGVMMRANDVAMEEMHLDRKAEKIMKENQERERELREKLQTRII